MADEQPEWGVSLSKFFCIPQRVILAILAFIGVANVYTLRVCLSVAIVKMVKQRNYTSDALNSTAVCDKVEEEQSDEVDDSGTYDWSQEMQGYILSAFYIGYLLTHLPGGMVADRYGAKWVLGFCVLISALCTVLSPVCIKEGGPIALIILRIIMGCAQGVVHPALIVLVSQWVPPKERGRLGAFIVNGGTFGTVAGNAVSGLILDKHSWEAVFYFFGIIAVVWFVFYVFLAYSGPESHPFIKQSEKDYLAEELGNRSRKDIAPTPFKEIFTSGPVWVMIIACVGHDWNYFVMSTDLPKYLNDVMQFPIKDNGVFSAMPWLSLWVLSIIAGFISDALVNGDKVSINFARKLMTTFASTVPGVFLVLASYAGCDRTLVIVLFTICMGCMGTFYAGVRLGPADMGPNYAGFLMALVNGMGAITGIIGPVCVGWMTPNTTMQEWRMVFWLSAFILISTVILYCIFGTSDVQKWNDPKPKDGKD